MYWTGSQSAIDAACAVADAKARDVPHKTNGVEIPRDQWSTTHHATPRQTADPDVWVVPVYPGLPVPPGCALVDAVDWPPEAE